MAKLYGLYRLLSIESLHARLDAWRCSGRRCPAPVRAHCAQPTLALLTKAGDALLLTGEITPEARFGEGYQHQPGIRNVLRLKRFATAGPGEPAGAIYVLDLVVQSEVVAD